MSFPRAQAAIGAALALAAGACSRPGPTTTSIPTLLSISPKVARAGGSGFTLTAEGEGFGETTVIAWGEPNGRVLVTTRVDPTHLTAKVEAEDIATPGVVKVLLGGEGASGSADFRIASAAEFPVARVCADLKSEMRARVATTHQGPDSTAEGGAPRRSAEGRRRSAAPRGLSPPAGRTLG